MRLLVSFIKIIFKRLIRDARLVNIFKGLEVVVFYFI